MADAEARLRTREEIRARLALKRSGVGDEATSPREEVVSPRVRAEPPSARSQTPSSPRRTVPSLDLEGTPSQSAAPVSGRKSASSSPRGEMTDEERREVRARLLERKKGREQSLSALTGTEEEEKPKTTTATTATATVARAQSVSAIAPREELGGSVGRVSTMGVREERAGSRSVSPRVSEVRAVSPRVSEVREERSNSRPVSPREERSSSRPISPRMSDARTSKVSRNSVETSRESRTFDSKESKTIDSKDSKTFDSKDSKIFDSKPSSGEFLKRQSLVGLEAAESVFAEENDMFGNKQPEKAAVTTAPVASPRVGSSSAESIKSPREVSCLADVLPHAPADSGDRSRMLQYAKASKEVLTNPKWAQKFQRDVDAAFKELCALLEEWLSLDSPDKSEIATQYCDIVLAWAEFRLASELPALRHKCVATFEMIEKSEEMLRGIVAGSFVSWGSRANTLLEGLRAAKRKAIQADSKVLTRLAIVVQEQMKETARLKKSLKEKEQILVGGGRK